MVIAPEVAEIEFDRFVDSWNLDGDVSSMEEEDRQSFLSLKRRLVRAIVSGFFVVGDDGALVYTLQNPTVEGLNELQFHVPDGGAVLGWDRFKERQAIHKLNSFMGAMTKQNPAVFAKMDGRDLKVAQAVAQLFLGS